MLGFVCARGSQDSATQLQLKTLCTDDIVKLKKKKGFFSSSYSGTLTTQDLPY